jgi:hypothetical protein
MASRVSLHKILLSVIILVLVAGTVWIFGAGGEVAGGKSAPSGMPPATGQRTPVDSSRPYVLSETSWGQVASTSEDAPDGEVPVESELAGLDVAPRR